METRTATDAMRKRSRASLALRLLLRCILRLKRWRHLQHALQLPALLELSQHVEAADQLRVQQQQYTAEKERRVSD